MIFSQRRSERASNFLYLESTVKAFKTNFRTSSDKIQFYYKTHKYFFSWNFIPKYAVVKTGNVVVLLKTFKLLDRINLFEKGSLHSFRHTQQKYCFVA